MLGLISDSKSRPPDAREATAVTARAVIGYTAGAAVDLDSRAVIQDTLPPISRPTACYGLVNLVPEQSLGAR